MSEIISDQSKIFLSTYKRLDLDIVNGNGVYLFDKNGEKYLDFFSGLAVNALGYNHPKIVAVVSAQIKIFAHISNYFVTDIQKSFSEKLLLASGMHSLFLTNSGTEATEAAIKLIRKKFGPDKTIFSLSNSFHGRTYGSLSLTDRQKYKEQFEPLLPNISVIEFNSIKDIQNKVDENTAAVFVEFIQGEGGINELTQNFVDQLNNIRNKFGLIVVADEIQSGIGRTGKNFAYQHYDFIPDIVLTAKAIGGGLPLGAMLINKDLENVFSIGDHGTTFGGNPVSCAAGKVVLEEVFENGLIESVIELGNYLFDQLNKLKNKFPDKIKDVRGKGFMLGVELLIPGDTVVNEMLKRKIIINCTNTNVIRLLPPLIIEKDHIDFFLQNFEEAIAKS